MDRQQGTVTVIRHFVITSSLLEIPAACFLCAYIMEIEYTPRLMDQNCRISVAVFDEPCAGGSKGGMQDPKLIYLDYHCYTDLTPRETRTAFNCMGKLYTNQLDEHIVAGETPS